MRESCPKNHTHARARTHTVAKPFMGWCGPQPTPKKKRSNLQDFKQFCDVFYFRHIQILVNGIFVHLEK